MTERKSFDCRCWELLKKIPKGKVTTYGELARALSSKGYRAVGRAMNRNPNAPMVPCHRVVKSDASLGGYAFGSRKKIALLRSEGIRVKKGRISDFERHFFSFSGGAKNRAAKIV